MLYVNKSEKERLSKNNTLKKAVVSQTLPNNSIE